MIGTGTPTTLELDIHNPDAFAIDDVTMVANVTPAIEKMTGVISFTDPDSDPHTVSVAPAAGGYVGTLTATLGSDSISGGPGMVNWTYTVPDAVLATLPAGQTVTQTYIVTINDGHGGQVSQNVVITLNDHAPVLVGTGKVALANEAEPTTGNLVQNGGLKGQSQQLDHGWFQAGRIRTQRPLASQRRRQRGLHRHEQWFARHADTERRYRVGSDNTCWISGPPTTTTSSGAVSVTFANWGSASVAAVFETSLRSGSGLRRGSAGGYGHTLVHNARDAPLCGKQSKPIGLPG